MGPYRPISGGAWSKPAPLSVGRRSRLKELGYQPGKIDGIYGPRTTGAVGSFQANNDLKVTGAADKATLEAAKSANAKQPDPTKTELATYKPGSPEQVALFEEAARIAGARSRGPRPKV